MNKRTELIEGYKDFLNNGKTERECVKEVMRLAKEKGYEDMKEVIASGRRITKGDKLYSAYMGKSIVLFHIGSEPIENGMRILGAHIDSPRLDIKQNPLYEDGGFAYLDTHYYGGVKKYQWVTIPLAIHGVVVKKSGEVIDVVIGEKEDDPVFCISDLLIHLAGEQLEKSAAKVIEGENLDVLVGSIPLDGEEKEAVKANVLKLLAEYYGMEEKDFISAELEVVPAGKARDMGFDSSMILAYGQDDRVCAYTSLWAFLGEENLAKTGCCLFVDKEEIGSVGATGMQSKFFENMVCELLNAMGEFSELKLRRCMARSQMLSSDVSAAFDPLFPSYFEKKNSAFFGKGIVFNKFTGVRGKNGSNDANAEYMAKLRSALDNAGVNYQTAEFGRVDAGGGGTIAYIMALYGMEVIDSGVALLSMHAPWEVSSKEDIVQTANGYRAFLTM